MDGSAHDGDARRTDRITVEALYRILLGRSPESPAIAESHECRPLTSFLLFMLQSPEFRQLARDVVARGTLPHFVALDVTDFETSAAWLATISIRDTAIAEQSWWSLMRDVIALAPRSVAGEYGSLATLADRRARAAAAIPTVPTSATVFDADWYRRANLRADLAIRQDETLDVATYFRETGFGERDQLLPYFSEALDDVYSRVAQAPPAIDLISDTIAETIRLAARRSSAHWFFSAEHYSKTRTDQPDYIAVESRSLFFDFVARQPNSADRPHPLFCPRSYGLLNRLPEDQANFDHYIRHGMFDGLRTSSLFDPAYYLDLNPNVRIEIVGGSLCNEIHHFIKHGIAEDVSFSPYFDVDFYLAKYPDVEALVTTGACPSATWHFIHRGLGEGRSPSRAFNVDYYSTRYPTVAIEMRELGLASALEHFLLVGRQRGYLGDIPLIEGNASLDDGKVIFQRRALRSLDRQSRRPVVFPARRDLPIRLSVIVPVCGQVHHTARLLECARFAAADLITHAGVAAELIVVDNGSSDETPELLAATAGITVVRFPQPIGFPRAVAAGIEKASGDMVIVANNDLEFDPDVFVRFVESLSADPTIGVLGGLVVLPNERVQDAGTFVDHEGNTAGVGRHEDPWSAFFRGMHEVDYCSGCFFGFRLQDYHDVGGMDQDFSPGYYEEVDFAFRMRERLGKRAVVASDIQVVHLEHGSFGQGRIPIVAEPVILRNRATFVSKHAQALADRPARTDLIYASAARPHAIARPRILVVVQRIPPAGDERTARLVAGLHANEMPFEILALEPDAIIDAYADRRVALVRGWMPGNDPTDILFRAAKRFTHVIVSGTGILKKFGPTLARTKAESDIVVICDAGVIPGLEDLDRAERLGLAMSETDRLAVVRAAVSAEVDVSLWLASSEAQRRILQRANVRRAVTVLPAEGRDNSKELRLILVGCGSDAACAEDAVRWCRASVAPVAPSARQLRLADIMRNDAFPVLDVSVGLTPALRSWRSEVLPIAIVPPRPSDWVEIIQALTSGTPILMSETHLRRLEADLGPASGLLAIVYDGNAEESYENWMKRLSTDPALVEALADAQRAWVEPEHCLEQGEDSRIVALR